MEGGRKRRRRREEEEKKEGKREEREGDQPPFLQPVSDVVTLESDHTMLSKLMGILQRTNSL